ncbi:hypothetical protein JCM11251_002245 [Rhodosporidiobolus azoricus]
MRSASSRPHTSPSAPSSSGFPDGGQHTPALSRHLSGGISSSSPPTDVIATPSAGRYDAPSRGAAAAKAAGEGGGYANVKPTRRSTRIRTSSGHGSGVQHPQQLDSSPQIGVSGSPFLDEMPIPHPSYPAHHAASARFPGASHHGGYQQQPHVARTPTHAHRPHPHHLQAAIQLDAPFSSHSQSASSSTVRIRPSFDDIMSRSAKRQKTSSTAPAIAGSGPSSGLEAVRQWAQEGSASSSNASSSSSDDDEDAAPMLQSLLTSHHRRTITTGGMPSPAKKAALLPSPAGLGIEAGATGRGVLERYLSDRSSAAAAKADEAAPAPASVLPEQGEKDEDDGETKPTLLNGAPTASSSSAVSALPPIPASPAARRLTSRYGSSTLLSPVPSRTRTASHNASVLFSPDVAKLLRSELDELEAKEGAGKMLGSPLRRGGGGVDRSSDIVVDDSYSSPYQRNASPFSSPQRRPTAGRDIFSASSSTQHPHDQHDSATKRARWNTVLTAQQESGLASPTPSSASLSAMSLRAPSFCDSSPAASDKGSVTSRRSGALGGAGGSRHHHPFLSLSDAGAAHPASAPDFLYGAGIPSSSPTSSQHSEYLPDRSMSMAARYSRSSPGPAFGGGSLGRSDSSATLLGDSSLNAVTASSASRLKRPFVGGVPRPALGGGAGGPPYGQGDPHTKPTFSYAALIGQALFSTGEDKKMALADIYLWVMKYYPYFKKSDSGWQNSIRHNLSLNPCFVKTARTADNPGKGCLWAIKPGTEDQFVDGDFVRKSGQVSARKSRGKKGRQSGAGGTAVGTATSSPIPSSREDVKFDPQGLLRAAAAAAIASSPSSTGSPSLAAPPPLPAGSPPHLARSLSHSVAGSDRGVSPALSVASSARPPLPAAMARRGSRVAFSPASVAGSTGARSVTPALASPLSPQAVALAPPSADLVVDDEHMEDAVREEEQQPTFSITPPSEHFQVQRPATAVGFARSQSDPSHPLLGGEEAAAAMTLRSHSSMGFVQDSSIPHPLPFVPPQQEQRPRYEQQQNPFTTTADIKPRLAAPPVMRTHSLPVLPSRPPTSPPASSSSLLAAHAGSSSASMTTSTSAPTASQSTLHEPLLSATMSPPTSVYYRLAGPYQPLSYSTNNNASSDRRGSCSGGSGFGGHDRTPSASHRALALLASPEAGGIMPGRPGERAAALFGVGKGGRSSPPDSTPFLPFHPAPSGAAGGTALRRTRTESDKDGAFGNMLSPGALVHTQSPISSVRGGPRQPMSPLQNSSEKLEPFPDPEKKPHVAGRAPGTRLLPAVNALATSASSHSTDDLFDPFRSPPSGGFATPPLPTYGLSAAGKAHLRSPSARLQAALSTPGGTKGRFPLGFSPSLVGGGAAGVGGAWGVAHPSSSSRSSAAVGGAGWEDDEVGFQAVAGVGVGGGFSWPSTPGMGIAREW